LKISTMTKKPPSTRRRYFIPTCCSIFACLLVTVGVCYKSDATAKHVSTVTTAESQDLVEHPLSRKARQAYAVFGAGESGLSVEGVGQEESGPWEPWEVIRECSRTCGGGVQIETRNCSGNCIGAKKRYVSCNIEPCPTETDFRAEQCAKYNDKALEGKYYKWRPFTRALNKCELMCIPEGENFYYKWAEKVIDGTRCDAFNYDICVEGFCLPVGCDNKLGSTLKEDLCRVCGGDGSTCKTVEGFFDESDLKPGYHDVIVIPTGATSIVIQERKPTNNYLALRNEAGKYWLNGHWKIDFPQTIEVAGTMFEYERIKQNNVAFEKLYAKGPTKEPVIVVLLRQTENSGIQYEFSVPLTESLPYQYTVGPWSACSVTCGQGIQERTVQCTDRSTKEIVDEEFCLNSTLPELNRTCSTVDCDPEWFVGEWEPCSETCGDTGMQYRIVFCHQAMADGVKVSVRDGLCTKERPIFRQPCNRFSCPEWHVGPWSSCSSPCGEAFQYRSVTCRSEKEGEEGQLLPGKACHAPDEPTNRRLCNLGRCEGLNWHVTEWNLCEHCNDTTETRNVSCRDSSGRIYSDDRCEGEKPIDERPCATPIPCLYKWHASQWSECSTKCGHGHQTRSVVCAIEEGNKLIKMDELHCDPYVKPSSRQNCTNEEKCIGTYFTSEWDECSAPCGGGTQKRVVLCFDYDYRLNPAMCDEDEKPADVQECNLQNCTACNETEFGCCPDNSTAASGPFLEGCSNCSLSEFGCCPDNYTTADGANFEGCMSEMNVTEEGIGLENDTAPMKPKQANNCTEDDAECCTEMFDEKTNTSTVQCTVRMCNLTNSENVTVEVPCMNITSNPDMSNDTDILLSDTTATLFNETDLFGNETLGNETDVHCSKTEFGCCPDWVTPALGPDNLNCTNYELGDCSNNGTKYGCCPDNLTLARGPKFEGCGDPICSASLYGCCPDRRTIAFGPHYKGCDRSTFSCESSPFGCCSDGKTAALGPKNKGCEDNCVISKYGCCPDGVTLAKGPKNEGCGCSLSQFGCCPDGQSTAVGPGFAGCPETCATSRFGCCPDGKTYAKGSNYEGCPCRYTRFGCCPDGVTAALGPRHEGCDDCRLKEFGCCPDGQKAAQGPAMEGCFEIAEESPVITIPPPLRGPVSPEQIGKHYSEQKLTSSCTLPSETGECSDYSLKWNFDPIEGVCRQFWYGGCGGNENRFESEEDCKHVCVNPPDQGVCYLPKIPGTDACGSTTIRWYYDITEGYCMQFYYHCNGNGNNFAEYDECMATCDNVGKALTVSPPATFSHQPEETGAESEEYEDVCELPVDTGPCRGKITQWYYEPAVGDCITFTWGGCKGNSNRFASKELCEAKCAKVIEDFCKLPKDSGPCDQYVAKWYYKHEEGTCGRFYYGGCHGNDNRFETMEECHEKCASKADPCQLPSVSGPCAGREMRYYWTGERCEQFTYGGCLGNSNNFQSLEQCQRRCGSKSTQQHMPSSEEVKVLTSAVAGGAGGSVGHSGVFTVSRVDEAAESSRPDDSSICNLPKDTGPCRAYIPSFYFDRMTQQCQQFVYGGCQGNENRFPTRSACEAACGTVRHQNIIHGRPQEKPEESTTYENFNNEINDLDNSIESDTYRSHVDYCNSSPEVGPCRDATTRWHYEPRRGECIEFVYGGCGGNRNNFKTRQDCERVCAEFSDTEPAPFEKPLQSTSRPASSPAPRFYPLPTSALPDLCLQSKDIGTCYGSLLNWYFDSERMQCTSFMYTGCGGNSNRFTSEEACERACGAYRDQDVCRMPPDEGPCLASVPKWSYNQERGECVSFVYGGCEGNGNRFSSKEECDNICNPRRTSYLNEDVCDLERDAGPCLDPISQWYFDRVSSACKLFTYGGCRGNANRFNTKSECEARCVQPAKLTTTGRQQERDSRGASSKKRSACELEFDSGPCQQSFLRKWYHDPRSHKCRPFAYGGCGGNDNRFDSEQECASACNAAVSMSITDDDRKRTFEHAPVSVQVDSTRWTYQEGQTIVLNCRGGTDEMHHKNNVVWYKDNRHVAADVSRRIEVQFNGSLAINSAKISDSGEYSCALLQPAGSFSSAVRVVVEAQRQESNNENCVDNPLLANCRLVVSAGLCSHTYYGRYCCQSCRNHKFINPIRLTFLLLTLSLIPFNR
ncbi:Papilin, partial [Trichinella britovi]